MFLMGSRARCEAGQTSDIEFGIILPNSADVQSFKDSMPSCSWPD